MKKGIGGWEWGRVRKHRSTAVWSAALLNVHISNSHGRAEQQEQKVVLRSTDCKAKLTDPGNPV